MRRNGTRKSYICRMRYLYDIKRRVLIRIKNIALMLKDKVEHDAFEVVRAVKMIHAADITAACGGKYAVEAYDSVGKKYINKVWNKRVNINSSYLPVAVVVKLPSSCTPNSRSHSKPTATTLSSSILTKLH